MKIFAKIKWVASILLVFFIVLVTNLIDRKNFNRLSQSVTTMYEDRIVASDLLFDMSLLIHQKELELLTADTIAPKKATAVQLNQLILKYEETKLTKRETFMFEELKAEVDKLNTLEQQSTGRSLSKLKSTVDKIQQYLHQLSKIQVEEGKRQVFISDKAKNTINLFTQGETIFLILMAILIQIIILYKPKA